MKEKRRLHRLWLALGFVSIRSDGRAVNQSAVARRHRLPEKERTGAPIPGELRRTGAAHWLAHRADAQLLATLLEQHSTLYEAAQRMPRVAELHGRGVAIAAQFGSETWLVRHSRRGGSVMSILGDRYVRIGTPRVLREWMTSERVRATGISTPAVRAVAWYDEAGFRRSDLASLYIADSHDLAAVIFDGAAPIARAVDLSVCLIRSIVKHGLLHVDLNLKNILIAPDQAYVLDLDRCEIVDRLRPSQVRAMRDRFFRSLAKWEAKSGVSVDPAIANRWDGAFLG